MSISPTMDLRALAVLAVLAIHALLVGFALTKRPTPPAAQRFAIQAGLVFLWSAGRLLTFANATETGLSIATLAGLASVVALAWHLGATRIVLPLLISGVALFLGHALAGSRPPALAAPWLGAAGGIYLLAPTAWRVRRGGATTVPASRVAIELRAATPILAAGGLWHALAAIAHVPGPRLDVVGVLASEAAVLAMIRSRQLDLEPEAGSVVVRLCQAVATSAVVLVGVAIVQRYAGVSMDPSAVTSLSALAFAATWLLGGSARWIEPIVERTLFPERARYRALALELAAERESLRSRLAESERLALVGELAATVAHEIKNPLGPIKGFAQMIAEDLERADAPLDRDVLKRRVGVIVEEVERIDERIRQLLDRARDRAETPSACALNEMLERSMLLVAGDASRRRAVRLGSALAATSQLPPLMLRRRSFESAMVNLLLNALDAVADEGAIEVCTALRGEAERGIEVQVKDDGCGIAPERLARIFDPFVSGRADGVGLGLGIARRAIEADGGTIAVESRLGHGTVVTIRLALPEPASCDRARSP